MSDPSPIIWATIYVVIALLAQSSVSSFKVPSAIARAFRTPPSSSMATEKTLPQRLLDFIEHPAVLGAVFVLGGIVGALIFTPAFVLCALSIVGGFHRTKVVSGKSPIVQFGSYGLLIVLLSVIGYFLYGAVNKAVEGIQFKIALQKRSQS
jgi:hypothetical protein